MDQSPLISIVACFYNVADCVDYCLASLLDQSYEPYEIVCVDDGSTDGTGELLDAQAERHERVRVVHKANGGGVYDARNAGVAAARGSFVSFVDGDDLVCPRYLSALASGLRGREDVMVVGTPLIVRQEQVRAGELAWAPTYATTPIGCAELLEAYMYEHVRPAVWGILAPRRIYLERPQPNMFYEDFATAAGYATDVAAIELVDQPIYGYVMRAGSVVHRHRTVYKQADDYLRAIDLFCEQAHAAVEVSNDAEAYFRALNYARALRLVDLVEDDRAQAAALRRRIVSYVRSHLRGFLRDGNVSRGNKLRMLLLALSSRLYLASIVLYERTVKLA